MKCDQCLGKTVDIQWVELPIRIFWQHTFCEVMFQVKFNAFDQILIELVIMAKLLVLMECDQNVPGVEVIHPLVMGLIAIDPCAIASLIFRGESDCLLGMDYKRLIAGDIRQPGEKRRAQQIDIMNDGTLSRDIAETHSIVFIN